MFSVTADLYHVGHMIKNAEMDMSKFSEGQKVKCRVIFVDFARKRIGVSLNSDILSLKSIIPSKVEVGDKLQLTVARRDNEKGLVLFNDDGVVAFAHVSLSIIVEITNF